MTQQRYINELKEQYRSKKQQIFGKNIFQFVFSTWITPLFSLGSHVDIDASLISKLKQSDTNQVSFQKFNRIFSQKSQNRSKYQGLTLAKSFASFLKKEIIIFIFLCFFLVGLQTYMPILNYQIVNYIEQDKKNLRDSIKYFLIFVILYFFQTITSHLFFYLNSINGINLANVLSLMIYSKVLKYPLISSKQFKSSQIINYSQVDCYQFQFLGLFVREVSCAVLLTILNVFLLYYNIGVSFLVGFGFLILFVSLSLYFFYTLINRTQKLSQANDSRIKIAEQIIQIIKFIKVNGLQEYFLQKIESQRQVELSIRMKIFLINAGNKSLHYLSSPIMVTCSILVFLWMGNQISTAKAFLLITIFGNIQLTLKNFPQNVRELIKLWISTQRIEKFLLAEQINDQIQNNQNYYQQFAIQIENGNFLWQKIPKQQEENINKGQSVQQIEKNDLDTQDRKYVNVLKEINLKIRSKQITMIIGDVGCGKSTLIYNILNETLRQSDGEAPKIKISGSIAYCAQKPWIMSGTVRDNIVFFQQWNEQRFNQAVYFSCMKEDLNILDKGVETQIGQKGVNLSGGQKARVSFARALYSNKDIYILDDVFSALDVHVSKFLMDNTIKGYLRGKTIIMITHLLHHINSADNVIVIADGKITQKKNRQLQDFETKIYEKINLDLNLPNKKSLELENKQENFSQGNRQRNKIQQNPQSSNTNELIKQLTLPQDQQSDEVSHKVYSNFFQLVGGKSFIGGVLITMIGWTIFSTLSNIQIQKWCSDTENPLVYLYLYFGFAIEAAMFIGICSLIMLYGQIRKGNMIHQSVMKSLVYANYIQFFTRVPKGRILNRLSNDLRETDQITTMYLQATIAAVFSILGNFLISIYSSSPLTIIPIAIVVISSILLFRQYIKSQRSVVRLQKLLNSPVLTGFTQIISGLDVIRAFKKNRQFINIQIQKMNAHKSVSLTRQSIQHWFFIRISFISFILNYSLRLERIKNGVIFELYKDLS